MRMNPWVLDLPAWATQDETVVRVDTFAHALEVLQYIPRDMDDHFSVVITDRAESDRAWRLTNGLRRGL